MPNITELILILIIIAIVFGFGKLTALGSSFGKLKNNFKKAIEKDPDEDEPIDITPEHGESNSRYDGPKPGTRKEPVEEADIEA